ncbi:cytochrome P450 705A22-like [Castanea sativa]|uniref:cytochrome P450 705A22-like n=1 Tax=Castanea sativa TaxID=21020 RepID=UPI003F64E36B
MVTMTDNQYYLVCFLLLFLTTLLYQFIFNKPLKKLPPSPPTLPVIGHLHLIGPSIHRSLQKLSTQYGPIFNLRIGFAQFIVVSSASVSTEIFKTHDLSFADHQEFAFSEKIPYGNSGFFTAPYGDYWRFVKKLCNTELLSTGHLERSRAVREKELARFLQNVFESAKRKEVVDLGVELMKLTNNMLCTMTASTSCSEKGDEAERIRKIMKDIFTVGSKVFFGNILGPFGILGFWLFGKQAITEQLKIDEILEGMLKEHEDQIGKKDTQDFIDILLKVYRDGKAEVKMTRSNIKAFLSDLFIGSTGTTSEVILWTITELINHPSVFNKVEEEINSVVGSTRLVDESNVENLPYLQAVVKETLRLYPPLPVTTRKCRQNCEIGGFEIPQETVVLINLYVIMRDPELWDNPNEFQPERFLVSSEKQESMKYKHNETFSFLPFGAGRRACPGSKLGLSMVHMAVATMVQCFNWEVVGDGGENKAKVNTEVSKGAFIHKAHPLKCLPIVKFNPFDCVM